LFSTSSLEQYFQNSYLTLSFLSSVPSLTFHNSLWNLIHQILGPITLTSSCPAVLSPQRSPFFSAQ
jgi:hypothetical protein